MDYRRDILPPVAGIGISLLLHGTLLYLNRDHFPFWQLPELETVVVELVTGNYAEQSTPQEVPAEPVADAGPPVEPAAPAPAPPVRPKPAREEIPPMPPPSPPVAPETPAPVKPAAADPAAGQPPPPPPPPPAPAQVARAAPPPPPALVRPESTPEAAAETPAATQRLPRLEDLMPTASDLARFAAIERLPDPTQEGVREATLLLGEQDIRYKGYLGLVEAAVNRTWRWKEAMLASGRGGSVVIQFSIRPDGSVANIEVDRGPGIPLLEAEAVSAVDRALFPPFPKEWRLELLTLFAQFDYKLE